MGQIGGSDTQTTAEAAEAKDQLNLACERSTVSAGDF